MIKYLSYLIFIFIKQINFEMTTSLVANVLIVYYIYRASTRLSNILLTNSNMYEEFNTYLIEMKPTSS